MSPIPVVITMQDGSCKLHLSVILSATMLFLAVAGGVDWRYRSRSGVMPTTSVSVTLKDEARNKVVPTRITMPRADGKFPVIIWSHGAFGSKDSYEPLVQFWAERGYIIIQPTHSDSLSLMPIDERQKVIQALTRGAFPRDAFRDWRERPRDISFVIDSLKLLCKLVPELEVIMDSSRIGVGGHSFGAITTQLVAGATARLPNGERLSLADERPMAFIAISPSSAGGLFGIFDGRSFEGMKRPMLLITGSNDFAIGGKVAEWRKGAFELMCGGDKYLLWIEGAYHDFGGISGIPRAARKWFMPKFMGGEDERHLEIVRSATLSFWDAYLKADANATEFILTKAIEQAGGVTLMAK